MTRPRRIAAALAVCSAFALTGCAAGSPSSRMTTTSSPVAAAVSADSAVATGSPKLSATIPASARTPAWTSRAVALSTTTGEDAIALVHLGPDFPLTLTQSATVGGQLWYQAVSETPGRVATGWLPSSAVGFIEPAGGASASLDALDADLASYLADLGTRIGLDIFDVTRGVTYTYNADLSYYAASAMKVPIMLTLLSQLEARRKNATAAQIDLMTRMIEYSDNDAATELYKEIGWQRGIRTFMNGAGIAGLYPELPTIGWGRSTITPEAMVALLTGLHNGTILDDDDDRSFALRLMRHIETDQRVGVGDSSPAGATVEMKDGWTSAPGDAGPYVMNSSGIVTLGGETYIMAVFTHGSRSYPEAFEIARHVSGIVGERLTGAGADATAGN